MKLEQALAYMQVRNLCLHYSDNAAGLDVYSAQVKLPITLRRAIVANQGEFKQLMADGSTLVCVNPGLHRRYWCRKSGVCNVCAKLTKWIDVQTKRCA